MQQGPRVAVIGLDCGTPQLLFGDLAAEVPNISKLMAEGMHGDLASITPPITVPAWACSMTGKTPGELGIYGFRNRKDTSYEGLAIAHSGAIKAPAVWDTLGKDGKSSLLIGVPPGFPPPKEFPGWRVGCFLTPPSADHYAYPLELEVEIEEELGGKGEYIFDIPNFRKQGMEFVLDQVFKMTERRFKVARRLVKDKPWDFFMLVEMGMDRLHHVFWHYFDPKHPLYKPGNPFEDAFQRYYRALDDEVGALMELLPEDAITIVMSDHGARPMMGGICFNDWLIENGYLTLKEPVSEMTPIAKTRDRLGPHDGVGRRGILRPAVPERGGPRAAGRDPAGRLRDRARRARGQARGDARAERRAARHQGAQAAGRVPGGTRRGPRPAGLLRRSRVAIRGLGRQPQRVHVRERHRAGRCEPRPDGHLRDEGRSRTSRWARWTVSTWSTWGRRSCRSTGSSRTERRRGASCDGAGAGRGSPSGSRGCPAPGSRRSRRCCTTSCRPGG